MSRRITLFTLGAVIALAVPASAHVTVNPSTATKGGFTKLTFRVPSERDDASTSKLLVSFPADHPLAFVSVKPHTGWTYHVTKSKLASPIQSDDGPVSEAVTAIEWSGGKIGPGEFDEFDVSVGPLPDDVDSLTFKAVQTYSNGTVVRWIDARTPGGAEPAHPAPVLTLTSADSATPSASPSAPQPSPSPTNASVPTVSAADVKAAEDKAKTATGLAIGGLVLGAIGTLAALAGRRRRS